MLDLPSEGSAGVPDAPPVWIAGWCGTAGAERPRFAAEQSAEAIVPGGIDDRREGPNAKPSVRTFVLVVVALTAANPLLGGLGGRV